MPVQLMGVKAASVSLCSFHADFVPVRLTGQHSPDAIKNAAG